jgi:beta-xylosidase
MKGTFWLIYSMNYGGCGLLKSTSGKAEGPYEDVKKDGPLTGEIDASLFQDDDGTVYWLYQNGKIARMTDDMTGLVEVPRLLKPANAKQVGFEGAFITKCNGKYILTCAGFNRRFGTNTYDCMAAVSDKLYGPYGNRYLAIPHAGHNMIFKTKEGQWMSTFFGTESKAIFMERPAILPITINRDGQIHPLMQTSAAQESSSGRVMDPND